MDCQDLCRHYNLPARSFPWWGARSWRPKSDRQKHHCNNQMPSSINENVAMAKTCKNFLVFWRMNPTQFISKTKNKIFFFLQESENGLGDRNWFKLAEKCLIIVGATSSRNSSLTYLSATAQNASQGVFKLEIYGDKNFKHISGQIGFYSFAPQTTQRPIRRTGVMRHLNWTIQYSRLPKLQK